MAFAGSRVVVLNFEFLVSCVGLGDLRRRCFKVTMWVEVPFERIEKVGVGKKGLVA